MLYEQVDKQEKEHLGGIATATGACRFCGQMATLKVLEEWDSDQIDELATENCECEAAEFYTERKQQRERADEKIGILFGRESDITVAEAAVDLLYKAVSPICDRCVASVSIDMGNGIKGKISMTTKGSIKVVRTKTDTSAYEA